MKLINRITKLITVLLFISTTVISAQGISSEVDSICTNFFKSSNKYTERNIEYRVVKTQVVNSFFNEIKNVDKRKSNEIINLSAEIAELESTNKTHISNYTSLNEKYEYTLKAQNSMSFFGLLIPKNQYNIIMWSLVFVLIALALIVFMMYNRSYVVTKQAKAELEEVKEEYEGFRKRALKREQEVAASYQRQINKLKGTSI